MSISTLLHHPAVVAARKTLVSREAETIATQADLSAIPAPSGLEGRRGARVAEELRAAGIPHVRTDAVGNVIGQSGNGAPPVVLAAHLDTVFALGQDVSVRRDGARLLGPGIADNARGLAGLLALARATAGWRTRLPIAFVATVGEEGAGDLRGVKHLFGDGRFEATAVIALDGAGADRVVHRALGARRFRIRFRGPGGHSWAAYGVANAAHAAAAFGAMVSDLSREPGNRMACSVVGLGGGTALNCIPSDGWVDVDLRSEDPETIAETEASIRASARRALENENARRRAGTPPLAMETLMLGDRPSGITPRTHPLVRAAMDATRAIDHEPELAAASTDANVPIALGIPAIAIGAGGRSGDTHLPTEWYDSTDGTLGLVRALLILAAVAGVE